MVKHMLEDNGLSDPHLLHQADARSFRRIFGCDAVLFIKIKQWNTKYLVIAAATTVSFDYRLVSCKTNTELWKSDYQIIYDPNKGNNQGLLGAIIKSAVHKANPNYIPLAITSSYNVSTKIGSGIPAGHYLTDYYQKDLTDFPIKETSKSVEPSQSE